MVSHSSESSQVKRPWRAEFLWQVFKAIFALLTEVTISGAENVPSTGALLLAPNHLSHVDPPLLYRTMPRHEDIVVMVADTYKDKFWFRLVIDNVRIIWIARGASDRAALKGALEILKQGYILGIAPEGTRSKTGKLQEAKTGAAFLATKANVPIVPVGLIGTYTAFGDLLRLRRPKLEVRFGKPLLLPPLEGENKAALLDHYTHEIMCRIAALLPDEYHGFYAGDKRIEELRQEFK